jgi:endonuclease/exonuclease/phosphatase family metal-dependent hydrolase
MSGQIFISYRRDDTLGSTGRIYDRLIEHFGRDRIFMDVDSIEPGTDFVEEIRQAVSLCDVVVAVIGSGWLQSSDDKGRRRLDNPEDFVRLEILANVITRFDVIAVQEIRDKTQKAIYRLVEAVNALGFRYGVVTSPRLGRTVSKEQYAFLFRVETVEQLGAAFTYSELVKANIFHREPFIARFRSKNGEFDFVLITVHTDASEATEELYALKDVLDTIKESYPTEKNFIILGDLNADFPYYDSSQPNPIPGTRWLIPTSASTTTSKSTHAYDRIIISEETVDRFTGTAGYLRFDKEYEIQSRDARIVSDHLPIFAEFYVK